MLTTKFKSVAHQGRGELTDRIKEKSIELFKRPITQKELRFMAYFQYCLMNEQVVDLAKIDADEIFIMNAWANNNYLVFKGKKVQVTKDFWDKLNQILYLGYVDISI